jgi:L-Ala-D/L-Glu epimerase
LTKNKFRLAGLAIFSVRWPLRRPFVTSLGSKSFSDNVIAKVRLSGGAEGYGEASSSLAMAFQTAPAMAQALRRLFHRFRGRDVRDVTELLQEAWRLEGGLPTAVAAFETAVWDALARASGIPFFLLWGGAATRLRTLLTVPVAPPDDVHDLVRRAFRRGFQTLKLKIDGRDPDLDFQRIQQAHRAAPKARFLWDANQSYAPERLQALLKRAERQGLPVDAVEEPFPKRSWDALDAFRRRAGSGPGVILDESVQTPADARRVCRGNLALGVNVKLAKSGLLRGKKIAETFLASGRTNLMIGCMAESPIGLAASIHWVCGMGCFGYADLDSDLLLRPVRCQAGYTRRGPEVILPKPLPAGLGVKWPLN